MGPAEVEDGVPHLGAKPLEVLSSVPAWWARRAKLSRLPDDWQDWRRALGAPPVELLDRGVEGLLGASPHQLGEAYACALSHGERVRNGCHYTPKALSDALWTEIDRTSVQRPTGPVVDPACGAGALLVRPVRQFVTTLQDADPGAALGEAARAFAGTDNDPCAAWLGSAILAAELLPLWARMPAAERERLPILLTHGDGLDVAGDTASVVVMNPPYGRAALGDTARNRWAASLYGHANWYGVFLHAAVERVKEGGIVAAVMPTSFLGGAYYQRLRRFLNEHAPLVRLRLIDDRAGVFASGVLQETCLALFEKGSLPGPVACSKQAINGRVRSVNLGRTNLSTTMPDLPWMLPRSPSDGALVRAASAYPHRLRDFGWKASTGPLVWNRCKPQISADRCAGAVPILWAADVEPGRVRRSAARSTQRWIVLRGRDKFMQLSEPVVLVQRTTAPEQPRRLVAAELTRDALRDEWGGTVVVENHVNVLRCESSRGDLPPHLLTAILNTPTLDRLFRCMTGTVAVSAYELEALPLPGADVVRSWSTMNESELAAAVAETFA